MGGRPGETSFAVLACSPDVVAGWDRLARGMDASPFARPGWVTAWAEAFGHELRVAAVTTRSGFAALLPVVVSGARVRTAADWHVPYTEAVARDVESLAELLQGLEARYRRVSLDFVLEGSMTERLATPLMSGRPQRRINRQMSPFVDTTFPWEDYLASLSTRKVSELRRRSRRLTEDVGPVRFDVVDGAGEWKTALDIGFALEASGWKGKRGTAVVSDPATERFYRRMAEWAADQKILHIVTLFAGERPVAFDLALNDGSRTWLLKTGFDHDLSRYAPGSLLRFEALRNAFARGTESYEFTGETEPWKREWTDAERTVVLIDVFGGGAVGRAELLAAKVGRRIRVTATNSKGKMR